jgi:plasmid stabilization system protein ParE
VARIQLAARIDEDLRRFVEHMTEFGVVDVGGRIEELIGALSVLEHSPHVGRLAGGNMRELVIGSGSRGYVALYRYIELIDTVLVLAIRAQRERGYRRRRKRS